MLSSVDLPWCRSWSEPKIMAYGYKNVCGSFWWSCLNYLLRVSRSLLYYMDLYVREQKKNVLFARRSCTSGQTRLVEFAWCTLGLNRYSMAKREGDLLQRKSVLQQCVGTANSIWINQFTTNFPSPHWSKRISEMSRYIKPVPVAPVLACTALPSALESAVA